MKVQNRILKQNDITSCSTAWAWLQPTWVVSCSVCVMEVCLAVTKSRFSCCLGRFLVCLNLINLGECGKYLWLEFVGMGDYSMLQLSFCGFCILIRLFIYFFALVIQSNMRCALVFQEKRLRYDARRAALTAFPWISVVADEDFLARRPEERGPVDGVVETQAAVVEDVDVSGADLVQRLELEGRDPALLQDQQRNTTSTAGEEREGKRWITLGEGRN